MTIALRLDHPTLADAYPVYISWVLGRTPKGALSWKFGSCGTRSLMPLSGADLLVYLEDPTVVLPGFDPGQCEFHLCDDRADSEHPNPPYVWKCGRVFCDKHAKTGLLKADYALGHFGPPTDYNPDDPPPWDEEKTPSENAQARLGATTVIDMGVSPVRRPVKPGSPLRVQPSAGTTLARSSTEPSLADALKASLRVKAPDLRVQAPSPRSS